jgi:hypothetical protein
MQMEPTDLDALEAFSTLSLTYFPLVVFQLCGPNTSRGMIFV